jgi:hypothetical protein
LEGVGLPDGKKTDTTVKFEDLDKTVSEMIPEQNYGTFQIGHLIEGPPCKNCAFWNPEVRKSESDKFDSHEISLCHSMIQSEDFSCFERSKHKRKSEV